MNICFVEIGNFRKLKAVRIDISGKTTIFVGANNSGKTSAMVALRNFLLHRSDFSVNDFTLSHWGTLDAEARQWERQSPSEAPKDFDWGEVVPFMDVWLNVPFSELHYVQKLLPTLDWDGSSLGVRLRYEPKREQEVREEYLLARRAAREVEDAGATPAPAAHGPSVERDAFGLWPRSMMEFLRRRLRSTFEVRAYLLDPSQLAMPLAGEARPQKLPALSEPIEGNPFDGLLQIDEIGAQRGFGVAARTTTKPTSDDGETSQDRGSRLSAQLRFYYSRHLDPLEAPEVKDLEALRALHEAQSAFGSRLKTSFATAFKELEDIGYPGVTDPRLTITTNIRTIDGINHSSAVQYEVPTYQGDSHAAHHLPEESNGLGYQNLVSMVFDLMSFRDKWMRVGKAAKLPLAEESLIPPLHLVLVEEPEAHLHAQVQQVFISQAYAILRKNDRLHDSSHFQTQLIVSTHSSHVAHEAEFASLRYFRRLPAPPLLGAVPVSTVANLSEVFGGETQTAKFVRRYLKATHCDLFFSDGAVLVEGPAERVLVPHFVRVRKDLEYLRSRYITWLEIGGSHAHRLRPLLECLGLDTLIITDLDAKTPQGKSVTPQRGASLLSRNETLKTWIPAEEAIDSLLGKDAAGLCKVDPSGYAIRVAYQQPLKVQFPSNTDAEALPNTFEDALLYENMGFFTLHPGLGLIARFREALASSPSVPVLAEAVAHALKGGSKGTLALDLLFDENVDSLVVPRYILTGLHWLIDRLKQRELVTASGPSKVLH